jgi:1-acyl-sn-glycerol-3-phosphate acyltransferase
MTVWIRRLVQMGLKTFFRELEVNGLENVPTDRGGIVVAWHPNGMVDPALIFSLFPRPLVFGARHGLFKWPILGWIMRTVGTVPIYRRQDLTEMSVEEQRIKNTESLDVLVSRISEGSFSALFPEGVSHDDPCLRQLKTGAARIFDAAYHASEPSRRPVIIPVGLHYDHKQRFRSSVLVNIHKPIELSEELWAEVDQRTRLDTLTAHMETTLTEVIYAMEDWEMHRNFHRAALLVRAERLSSKASVRSASISERVIGVARLWEGYHQRKLEYSKEVEAIVARIEQYRLDMESLGLLDHQLDGDVRWISRRVLVILVLQSLLYAAVFPPLLFAGYVINFPTMALIRYFVQNFVTLQKDRASVQLFSSIILYPLTWLLWSLLAYFGHLHATPLFPTLPNIPIASALFVGCISMISCVVMFVYLRAVTRMLRAWKVRWTKRSKQGYIEVLLEERRQLTEELLRFAEGLDLPGELGPDNKLHWREE